MIGKFFGKNVEILNVWEGSRGPKNLNATVRNLDGTKVNDGIYTVEEYTVPLGLIQNIRDISPKDLEEEESWHDHQAWIQECEEMRQQSVI